MAKSNELQIVKQCVELFSSFRVLLFCCPLVVCQWKEIDMNQSKQLVRLIEIAIMTAAAVILDIISGMFLSLPQGGSVSIMMIPIF